MAAVLTTRYHYSRAAPRFSFAARVCATAPLQLSRARADDRCVRGCAYRLAVHGEDGACGGVAHHQIVHLRQLPLVQLRPQQMRQRRALRKVSVRGVGRTSAERSESRKAEVGPL